MRERVRAVAGRVAGFLATLIGASLITFAISHLIPNDPARLAAGDGASPEVVAQMRERLGLDQPIWEQYLRYVAGLARGDFGLSIRSGEPVLDELLRAAPATIELALAALILIVAASLTLGAVAAMNHNKPIDHAVRVASALSLSTPTFWSALALIGIFGVALGWAPLGGRLSVDVDAPAAITGLVVVDAALAGRFDIAVDALAHLALPAVTLAIAAWGGAVRLFRAALLDVLQQDFVRRARAAGLSPWRIATRYAAPPALVPYTTAMGLTFADLLGGAVVTEMIFNWPGLGAYTMQAIAGLDFPAIMGFTLLAAVVYASINLLVDVLIGVIDPRTRSQRA